MRGKGKLNVYFRFVCLVAKSCPTLFDPMDCNLAGSSAHGDSPSKNTGVGCHALRQGICPTQGSNPGLTRWRRIFNVWAPEISPVPRILKAHRVQRKREEKSLYLPWRKLGRGSVGPFNPSHTAATTIHTRGASHPRCRRTGSPPLHSLLLHRAALSAFLPLTCPIPVREAGV